MNKSTHSRELTKEERQRFGWFLFRENLEPIYALYSPNFWEYYQANIEGMEYFSCPRVFSQYFKDGDLIRILIADEDEDFPSVFWWFRQNKAGTFERLTPQTVPAMQDGSLVCICGNRSNYRGFYLCNEIGSKAEPTLEAWLKHLYCCDQCGRIINYDMHQVEGFRQPNDTDLK
jgi:hypothetical protein